MRRIFLSVALLAATSILMISCKKGDVGPAGPAGAAGPAGPAGPTGPIGTANVIYSNWFKFQATEWADTTVPSLNSVRRANKATASMTQAIVDNGLVMAYMKYQETDGTIGPLQLPVAIPLTGGQANITTIPAVGRVIYVGYTIPSAPGLTISSSFQYRYIIIPGGVAGRGETPTYNGFTAEELKAMPYERVAKMFNIPEEGGNN